jgi:hypothetical protein
MNFSTVEEFMAIFPHPDLPTVQGESDYKTIHATRKFLQANSRAIDTHLGGGTLGHLGLIISDASYAMTAPTTNEEPTLWVTPNAPGGRQQNPMEQRPKSALLATCGKRMFKLTGHAPLPRSIEEADHQCV